MEAFHVKHGEAGSILMKPTQTQDADAYRLGSAARDRLTAFAALLTRWNPTIRLVSSQDIDHLWARHIDDALQLVPLMPQPLAHAIDLGSGGGFPGLILALATEVHFDLVEADSRKAAFLQEVITITRAPATIYAGRIEDIALESRMLVTARALAPLPRLLELSKPFLAEGGTCIFPKGERAGTEIAEASREWIMDVQQIPSRTSPDGRILRITNPQRRKVNRS
jgi:16S rRNA (guanine527-N7)-methyltransferase